MHAMDFLLEFDRVTVIIVELNRLSEIVINNKNIFDFNTNVDEFI